MPARQFLTEKEEQQIIDAISEVESKTSGEIRIHIEHHCEGDALERAAEIFHELGMDETHFQNGVLIYVATEDHKVSVYAGKGIHKKVDDGFWDDILKLIVQYFKKDAYEQGLEEAIRKVGNKLKELFPYHQKGDMNELTDEISYNANA